MKQLQSSTTVALRSKNFNFIQRNLMLNDDML